MNRFILIGFLCVSGVTQAEPLLFPPYDLVGSVVNVGTNVATFDPINLVSGPAVDVYQVVVQSNLTTPISSLAIHLDGPFINGMDPPISFSDLMTLPTLGPNTVAESFITIPSGKLASDVLAVDTIDAGNVLSSSFTLVGGATLVEPQGSAVIAILSLPTGATLDTTNWRVNNIPFIPEPTTGVLVGHALIGAAGRRRV